MAIFNKQEVTAPVSNDDIETVIGHSVKIEGSFISEGNLMIDGQLKGTLATSKNLRLGENSIIEADIQATNAIVAGKIQGNLKVSESLELLAGSIVTGDVDCGLLTIEPGATINGKCIMRQTTPANQSSNSAKKNQSQNPNEKSDSNNNQEQSSDKWLAETEEIAQ